jgi:hypothetical protein
LIESGFFLQPQQADSLQNAHSPQSIHVSRVLGSFERDLHMALGGQIIDFVGLHQLQYPDQVGGVGQVSVMQDHPAVPIVGIFVKVVNAVRIEL